MLIPHKITQHGVLSWDLNFKKRKERIIKRNQMKIFRKYQARKQDNPQVLKILKFIGNKIDWDYKIVKNNSEKQENNFAKQFST